MKDNVDGSALMPIGKYKGKSLEVVAADSKYCEWLVQQDWANERYGHIIQFISNGAQENQETPEHNRIQALFLDRDFRLKVARLAFPDYAVSEVGEDVEFEHCGMDCAFSARIGKTSLGKDAEGEDWWSYIVRTLFIEIKPSVSDDYPVVMRQMKTARSIIASQGIGQSGARLQVLYTEKITSKHLTEAQIIAMFAAGKIVVVTKAMVDAI
jgi:uncharacterized protein (DUF3820 family)